MDNSLKFIRPDLTPLASYTPNPSGEVNPSLDRLDANESPFDLPEELKSKLASVYVGQVETNRYPDGSHLQLKRAIATYVNESGRTGSPIDHHHISVGNGSDELIRSLLISTCLGGSGSILVADPTFSMYGILARTLAIPVASIPRREGDFAIDLEAAGAAITARDGRPIKVIFVVHPNSPTGNCLTEGEIDWLRNIPQEILVVIDEAYFEFSQKSLVAELNEHPNWVILRTFSKAFRLAAHRVGYAIASEGIVSILEKVRLPYNLPTFAQRAANLVLENRELVLSSVREIVREREKLSVELGRIKDLKIWRSDANFVYLQLTKNRNTDGELNTIVEKLRNEGTLVRHTGGGLRITVGNEGENRRTVERLAKILL